MDRATHAGRLDPNRANNQRPDAGLWTLGSRERERQLDDIKLGIAGIDGDGQRVEMSSFRVWPRVL